ncbi:MAG: hypothetical protein Q4Q04_00905 [Methanocorpusculum sp.]|nr:hypothetical protein [Methanocorpusculum sp.]
MIFPPSCKYIGNATTQPFGEKVYFITQYLVHPTADGPEILEVRPEKGCGVMRSIASVKLLAGADEVAVWDGEINPHNRADLIRKALSTKKRCTLFGTETEHMTFVFEPDLSAFETVHVYDITPPHPNLSDSITALETIGYFEKDNVIFEHHVRDISRIQADVYPCRAGGFSRTLDRDCTKEGDVVACCKTGRQMCREAGVENVEFKETCPASQVNAEPFIARCCRAEDSGIQRRNGYFGVVVHWASSSRVIAEAVVAMLDEWRRLQEEKKKR